MKMSKFNVPIKTENESVDAYQKRFEKFIRSLSNEELFDYIKESSNCKIEGGVSYENSN